MSNVSSFGSENAKAFLKCTSMTRAFPSTKRFSSTKTRFEVRKNKWNVAQHYRGKTKPNNNISFAFSSFCFCCRLLRTWEPKQAEKSYWPPEKTGWPGRSEAWHAFESAMDEKSIVWSSSSPILENQGWLLVAWCILFTLFALGLACMISQFVPLQLT